MTYKDILSNIIRLVVVYSCERMKILNKYPDVNKGLIFLNEEVVKPKIRQFLMAYNKNLSMVISQNPEVNELFADWDEEKINYEFLHYFWDFIQEQPVAYNSALLKQCNLNEATVTSFFKKLSSEVKSIRSDYPLLDEYYEFSEQFSISSLLTNSELNQWIFIYYRILYELETTKPLLSGREVNKLFLKLIKLLPYYSPFTRKYLTTFSREPHHLTLSIPLSFSSGMLLDTLFHFFFQLIQELFYTGFFNIDLESEQNDIAIEAEKKKIESKIKEINAEFESKKDGFDLEFEKKKIELQIRINDIDQKVSSGKKLKSQQIDRFSEVTRIMSELFKILPNEQLKTYKTTTAKSLDSILFSILFVRCESQFENDIFYEDAYNASFLKDFYEMTPSTIENNEKKKAQHLYKAFFKFIKFEFENQGFKVDIKTEEAIDKWTLVISYGKDVFRKLSGNDIRGYLRQQKSNNIFNYE
ncbi:hypothetical protein ABLT35_09955 [Acinetobacter johnsonii]|jgi:hypothetical protein|uniref:hypothetical protein n=1 Tax=Acinetobacter johnsonii TaxID=40214 RepID=UPI00244ABBB9|nr:hypothetical protein [Acinetobacter johnsonii]MDH1408151.1 hypothetical protein [Acinetobacter johnsonii]